jgi:hypothetical protein
MVSCAVAHAQPTEVDKAFVDIRDKYLICSDANGFDSPACAGLKQQLDQILDFPSYFVVRLVRNYNHLFAMGVCNDDMRYPMDLALNIRFNVLAVTRLFILHYEK